MANGDNMTGLDAPVLNDTDYVQKIISSFDAVDTHDHSSGEGVQIPSGGIEDDAIVTAKILDGAVTNAKLASGTIDLTDKVTGILPLDNGGTGIDASAVTDGQLLIGGTSANDLQLATITGTSNRVSVTNSTNSITLSTPQDIHTGASPEFAGATYSGLTASRFVVTDGSKALASQEFIDLTSDVSGDLPIAEGGTGQSTATAGFDALAPTTTKGDLVANDGTNNIRVAAGTNGYILSANSGVSAGVEWIENTAGGGSGFVDPGLTITGDYAADADDAGRIILVDTSSTAITVTLPTPSAGFVIGIKDVEGLAPVNAITIERNGSENIDSSAGDDVVTESFGCKMFISDGTDWYRWAAFQGASTGGRALFAGGYIAADSNIIDSLNISTLGNASDFGDLTDPRTLLGATASTTRAVFGGGDTNNLAGSYVNILDTVEISTASNATDFGDLTVSRAELSAGGNTTRGIFVGGFTGSNSNVADYITYASASNATDFGDTSAARYALASCDSPTRTVVGGGIEGGEVNVVEFFTTATTGNATDIGDLTLARARPSGASSSTRGVFAGRTSNGAVYSNVIDYIDLTSTNNATDFGDLQEAKGRMGGISNGSRAVFGGGFNASINLNVIDTVEIASVANATDFGDLSAARRALSATSNAHGGLQ